MPKLIAGDFKVGYAFSVMPIRYAVERRRMGRRRGDRRSRSSSAAGCRSCDLGARTMAGSKWTQ